MKSRSKHKSARWNKSPSCSSQLRRPTDRPTKDRPKTDRPRLLLDSSFLFYFFGLCARLNGNDDTPTLKGCAVVVHRSARPSGRRPVETIREKREDLLVCFCFFCLLLSSSVFFYFCHLLLKRRYQPTPVGSKRGPVSRATDDLCGCSAVVASVWDKRDNRTVKEKKGPQQTVAKPWKLIEEWPTYRVPVHLTTDWTDSIYQLRHCNSCSG